MRADRLCVLFPSILVLTLSASFAVAQRKAIVPAYGGTARSERAVAASLNWLSRHQAADGHWRFDPPAGSDKGYPNPGTWKSDAGATALALLPFLGAGQTHLSRGTYRTTIQAAITWLLKHQKQSGDLAADGSPAMLSHALATLALSEAYGLTADKATGKAAQQAVQFIVASQDPKTGGWGEPSQPPCLSITAWQTMALASAKLAKLTVPPATLEKAARFLEGLRSEDDARYRETSVQQPSDRATAMGLLAEAYLGSKAGQGQFGPLSQKGPAEKDALANFWATTLLHAHPGPEWDSWNRAIRRQLATAQDKEGDETGSWWNPNDADAASGGRLFQTALGAMTLEVYYRYLPLFK